MTSDFMLSFYRRRVIALVDEEIDKSFECQENVNNLRKTLFAGYRITMRPRLDTAERSSTPDRSLTLK